jgi:MHS family shikimate/dehydroshikimate transporter-like MFS transporter
MTENQQEPAALPTVSPQQQRRVLLAAFFGSLIEWFDFYLYGAAAAVVFNVLFFPNFDPLVGVLASFAVLGAGFLLRPLGGIVWGHFGDRLGRKNALVASIVLMGVATTLVGVLPTYDQIGLWSAVLLVTLRVVQGLAAGGEWGGSIVITVEHAPARRRGLWSSATPLGMGFGIMLATLSFGLVATLPEDAFLTWGWRVPFLASIVLVALGVWIRLGIVESPIFQEQQRKQAQRRSAGKLRAAPLVQLLRDNPRKTVLATLIALGPFAASTIYGAFGLAYVVQLDYDRSTALFAKTVGSFVVFVYPLIAILTDRMGRRPVYMVAGVAQGLMAFPMFWFFNTLSVPMLFLGYILIVVCHGVMYLPINAILGETFPTEVRYTGASFAYQVAGAFSGAFVPSIATGLLILGGGAPHVWLVAVFMFGTSIVGVLAAFFSKETYRTSLIGSSDVARPEYERGRSEEVAG